MNKNGYKDRIVKKIKYVRKKKPARINLNVEIRKMIEDVYAGI
jgi:hypothetical protein